MSASRSSLTARLKKLEAAQVRAEAMPSKTRLDARPMAELLGTTWVSVRDWCDEIPKLESSGAVVRGGNGIKWQFEPKRTIKILIAHFRNRAEAEGRSSRKIAEVTRRPLPDSVDAPALTEIKVSQEIGRNDRRERLEQAELCNANHSRTLHRKHNERVKMRVMGLVTKIDPNGNLPAPLRKKIELACRDLLSEINEDGVDLEEEFNAAIQQNRTL